MNRLKIRRLSKESGKGKETILQELEMLQREYGVSEATYLEEKLYNLNAKDLVSAANKIRLYNKYIRLICEETKEDEKDARLKADQAIKEYDITIEKYYSEGYYHYTGEALDSHHEFCQSQKPVSARKTYWLNRVCNDNGCTMEEAKESYRRSQLNFNTTPKEYYELNLFNRLPERQGGVLLRRRNKEVLRSNNEKYIKELSGKDHNTIVSDLRVIRNHFPQESLGFGWYYSNGVYEYNVEKDIDKIEDIVEVTKRRRKLQREVTEIVDDFNRYEVDYESIKEKVEEYTRLTNETLSAAVRLKTWEKMAPIINDESAYEYITLDMTVMRQLFGFSTSDYVVFRFWEKDMNERLTFLSTRQKTAALRRLNAGSAKSLLNNKYASFLALEPYYGRKMKQFDSFSAYKAFVKYVKHHPVFVKKDNFSAMGKGFQIVRITDDKPLRDVYDEITVGGRYFLAEDLIRAHEIIRSLNPDSVNTVRIVTYAGKNGIVVDDCFMKVGRAGSVVDNGGAGGILVHIDKQTGAFDSDGIDENSVIYINHPDHGYQFSGFQLPEWDDALKLAKEAMQKVEGGKYIGWDLTYDEHGKWIIVEGNGATQFVGQQGTVGVGKRKMFLELVHDDLVSLEVEAKDKSQDETEEQIEDE